MDVIIDGVRYIQEPKFPKDKGMLSALEVRFDSDAGGSGTVRDYLRKLLETLWREEEGFSGKRPFGNSGWQWEVHNALARAGFIEATVNDDEMDMTQGQRKKADEYIQALIVAAFHGVVA